MKFHSGRGQAEIDRLMYEKYFREPEKNHGTCIECGALDGVNLSICHFFERYLGWKCINIEANPDVFKTLCINRPYATNINRILSAQDYRVLGFACDPKRPKLSRVSKNSSVQVQTITYRTLIQEQKLTQIDLFVLDVEDHELEVLEGMKGAEVLPDYMCIEVKGGGGRSEAKTAQINKALNEIHPYSLQFCASYNGVWKKESTSSLPNK